MNMRIWYGISAVHVRISMLYMFHIGSLWWFMIDIMLYDDLCLEMMISTYNVISIGLIMLMICLVSWLGLWYDKCILVIIDFKLIKRFKLWFSFKIALDGLKKSIDMLNVLIAILIDLIMFNLMINEYLC